MIHITISILCHNKSNVTKKCIQVLENALPKDGVEIIFTANGCNDDTEDLILRANLSNKVYLPHGINLGFIRGHNEALKIARGHIFIALNNDMLIFDKDWPFIFANVLDQNPTIGLVGLQGNPSVLKEDGVGSWGHKLEYIDGSCIAGRTEDFVKYGLFSESLEMFYYEDSDLSLRFRQMKYDLSVVPLKYQHARSSTADTINPLLRHEALMRNGIVFKKKWGTYLRSRELTNNILVRMNSHGGGDIICMTPILEVVRKEHPTANIELETNWPEIFYNNPYINSVHGVRRKYNIAYDRIVETNPNYAAYGLIVDEAAKVAGVKVNNKTPQLFLSQMEMQVGINTVNQAREKSDVVIVIGSQMARNSWAGRDWGFEHTKELINIIENDLNIACIEIGKGVKSTECATLDLVNQTTLRELFSIIGASDLAIMCDSLPLHIAASFNIPTFAIFGATEPISRICNFSNTFFIRNEGLPCVGCYQKKGLSNYNQCFMGTEQCMSEISPEEVILYLTGEIDAKSVNIEYLQSVTRGELS